MRNLRRFIIATILVTTGCYGAVSSTDAQKGADGTASADKKSSGTSTPAANGAATSGGPSSPNQAEAQQTTCTADASVCDQTQIATKVTVTLDGKSCAVKSGVGGSGLDMGLDYHGWTAEVDTDDCGGFILEVSGLDNEAYPQTATVTFDQTDTIQLFTNDQNGDADGGTAGGTFLSSLPGASAVVESGPVDHVAKTIKGHAVVPNQKGNAEHTITFEMDF